MSKGHECPICNTFTVHPKSTNTMECSKCFTVFKKETILGQNPGAAGLPQDAAALAALVEDDEFANLAAALVRVARAPKKKA